MAEAKTQRRARPAGQDLAPDEGKENLPAKQMTNDAFGAFAGAGAEHVTANDIIIPRIAILQALSPQVDEGDARYIRGAKPGLIADIGISRLIGTHMSFVPVHFKKAWLEWAPRNSGEGLKFIHDDAAILDQCHPNEKKQPTLGNGNTISEVSQLFGLDVGGDSPIQVFIPFASTQIKKARKLLTLATSERIMTSRGEIQPPLFYRSYLLGSLPEQNAEGKWMGWTVERGEPIMSRANGQSIFDAAVRMREQIEKGEVRGDLREAVGDDDGHNHAPPREQSSNGQRQSAQDELSDEIPF